MRLGDDPGSPNSRGRMARKLRSGRVDEGTGELNGCLRRYGKLPLRHRWPIHRSRTIGQCQAQLIPLQLHHSCGRKDFRGGRPDRRSHPRILAALQCARSLGADENPAWKPTALNVQGLSHEQLGQYPEAVQVYEEALALNPKIGVKRRLASVSKRVKAE